MNAKTSAFVIFVEAIVYLLLYNFHDSTFNGFKLLTISPKKSSIVDVRQGYK